MIAFLDTSSLVKLYHREPGSDHVMGILGSGLVDRVIARGRRSGLTAPC